MLPPRRFYTTKTQSGHRQRVAWTEPMLARVIDPCRTFDALVPIFALIQK